MLDLSLTRHFAVGALAGACLSWARAMIEGEGAPLSYLVGLGIGGAIGGAILGAIVFMVRRWMSKTV